MKNQGLKLLVTMFLASALAGASAFAGGVGDGGGNVRNEGGIDADRLKGWLDRAKEPTFFALHLYENTINAFVKVNAVGPIQGVSYANIQRKLFTGPHTVYQALNEAVFEPVKSGGCEGPNSKQEKDANSQKSPPNICFSLQRLKRKMKENFGKTQLIALIVHEVSHMVGASEDEAQFIQLGVQSQLSDSAFDNASQSAREYRQNLSNHAETVKNFIQDLPAFLTATCTNFSYLQMALAQTMNRESDKIPQLGLLLSAPQDFWGLVVVTYKLRNVATGACFPQDTLRARIAPVLKPRKTMSIADYIRLHDESADDSIVINLPDATIRWIEPGDMAAIKAELNDIVNLLENAKKSSELKNASLR